ncbi:hypothetical protein CLOM_g21307, partial [Closterium sp. NIES-68]
LRYVRRARPAAIVAGRPLLPFGLPQPSRKYSKILDIELTLPPRPPGFAFVELADPRDAEDAIRELAMTWTATGC